MIVVRVVRQTGIIKALDARGHAGIKDESPICAAVSILLRTTGRALVEKLKLDVLAPAPGEMRWQISNIDDRDRDWLSGVSDLLLRGLSDLSDEFPDQITLHIT